MSGVAVQARGLGKSFLDGERRVEVLRGVDLDLVPGDLVAIVGPSGSGKSTLLHLLGGLERADAGTLEIGGLRWDGLGERELARERSRTLGFVFQFHQLLPDFTALENVALPGRIAGWSARRALERATQLLADVGLADRSSHFPSELSGGERQRTALCRALFLDPPLLLADEPTGNLDPGTAELVHHEFMRLIHDEGLGALIATHNIELGRRMTRLVHLEGGQLVES